MYQRCKKQSVRPDKNYTNKTYCWPLSTRLQVIWLFLFVRPSRKSRGKSRQHLAHGIYINWTSDRVEFDNLRVTLVEIRLGQKSNWFYQVNIGFQAKIELR